MLHGGGNTSLEIGASSGASESILWVKESGADLACVEPKHFTPVRLRETQALLECDDLSNAEMFARLSSKVARQPAPRPSVETLLHAALPFRYVDHTHADAVLAVANTQDGERVLQGLYGDLAPVVAYCHSGAALARACAETYQRKGSARTIGLILRFHGVVAFGGDARSSYENMIRLVTMAEDYLKTCNAWTLPEPSGAPPPVDALDVAKLRADVSRAAGFPLVMRLLRDPASLYLARHPHLPDLSQQGPATPQHAIFTRRVPMLGTDVAGYVTAYRKYLTDALGPTSAGRVDPTPRIVIDPSIGVAALGVTAQLAEATAEVYRHNVAIMLRASGHGTYRSAAPAAMAKAELEYGGLEAREREKANTAKPLLGQVIGVTSSAAGRDGTLVATLLDRGAAVAIAGASPPDRSASLGVLYVASRGGGDAEELIQQVAIWFGGLDALYIGPDDDAFAEACVPVLALSPMGGGIHRVASDTTRTP